MPSLFDLPDLPEPEGDIPAANGTARAVPAPADPAPATNNEQPRRRQRRRRASAPEQAVRIASEQQTDKAPPAPSLSDLTAVREVQNDESAGARLQRLAVLTEVSWSWFGNIKRIAQSANTAAAHAAGVADEKRFKGSIEIIGKDEPEWSELNSFRSRVMSWWHSVTLPWVKEGERLLPRDQWDTFQAILQAFRDELAGLCEKFDAALPRLKETAARKLGQNYSAAWLAVSARDTFKMNGEARSVEPPAWLREVRPEDYAAQMETLRQRFDAAAQLATEALAQELLGVVAHLEDKLTPDPSTGDRKTFRDSSVENLREFFVSFRTLNITGNAQLEELVNRAERLLQGVSPDELRQLPQLADRVRSELTGLANTLESTFLIEAPKRARNLLRPGKDTPSDAAPADAGAA